MMRKLTKKDHEQVFAYLKEEAALNLFIIGILKLSVMTQIFKNYGEYLKRMEH